MACYPTPVDQLLRSFSGARVRRVIDRSHGVVPEHAHDWPVLSLFVLGGYENGTELGQLFIAGPSAVLYRQGAAHQNRAGAAGFEQIEIEFDPAWLGPTSPPAAPVRRWVGGSAGADSRALAKISMTEPDEAVVRSAVRRFVGGASGPPARARPGWVDQVDHRLRDDPALKVQELARQIGCHPVWLGVAYRRATAEGIPEAAARFRVERAARMLRETEEAAASIAAAAGFCDQSHMNRTFRRVLGRLPSAIRSDRAYFRP
jgi:AraC-like DNA-binding protein